MEIGVLFTQGVISGAPHTVLGEILEQAQEAERLGFSAALTTEHKYSEEYFGSPIPISFAIAARTSRVRVGTAIAIAPLYNPVELAQDAATLDQLSGGRLSLGLGAGYLPVDYDTVGVPWDQREARFDECIRIIRSAWTQERFSFAGDVFRFDDVAVIPRPLQSPPPIALAAWTPRGLRRAGRLGDAWISNALMSLDTIKLLAAAYREAAHEHGRQPRVSSIRFCWPARSREEADAVFGPTSLAMAKTLFEYGAITDLPDITSADQITLEDFVRDRFIYGTPEECADTIRRFRDEVGIDEMLLIFRYPTGPAHDQVVEAMQLFSSEVMPLLRDGA
jgi:probable F420-dependent oxidoreductase